MRCGWAQQTVIGLEGGSVRCTGVTGRASLSHRGHQISPLMNDTSATAPLLENLRFPLRNKHFLSLITYFAAVL